MLVLFVAVVVVALKKRVSVSFCYRFSLKQD